MNVDLLFDGWEYKITAFWLFKPIQAKPLQLAVKTTRICGLMIKFQLFDAGRFLLAFDGKKFAIFYVKVTNWSHFMANG